MWKPVVGVLLVYAGLGLLELASTSPLPNEQRALSLPMLGQGLFCF